jgi:DNA-binding protein HU-beta
MNKQELIGSVADAAGLSKGDATRAVEAVFDSVSNALKKGDEVRLVGFGTFSVSKRKASTGRNPRTGEPMKIKASSQPADPVRLNQAGQAAGDRLIAISQGRPGRPFALDPG